MAASRARTWMLLAAPGVLVLAFAAWALLPSIRPVAAHPATAPASSPRTAVTPARSVAADVDAGQGPVPENDDPPPDVAAGRIVDADGRPLGGGALRWTEGQHTWTSYLGADGGFRLRLDVATPGCEIEVSMDDGYPDSTWVRAGRAVRGRTDLVFRLPAITSTTGTLQDADGRPLAGWTVVASAKAPQTGVSRAVTDEHGVYTLRSFAPLAPGLFAVAPGGGRSGVRRETAKRADAASRVVVTGSLVSGTVVCEDGTSADGAVVRLLDADDRTVASVAVDRAGTFAFDSLPSHTEYRLAVTLSGYTSPEPRAVLSGCEPLTLYLAAESQLVAGRVLDSAGEPLGIRWISLVDAATDASANTCTDVDGAFSTLGTRGAAYETFLLEPGADGRLARGRALGRCVAGSRDIVLRAAR